MTRGRGGFWIPPKIDDVIYEQPLTAMTLRLWTSEAFPCTLYNLNAGNYILSMDNGEVSYTKMTYIDKTFPSRISKTIRFKGLYFVNAHH